MRNRKTVAYLIAAIVFFTLAIFFAFALIGYSFTALIFAGFGALSIILLVVDRMSVRRPRIAKNIRFILAAVLLIGFAVFMIAEVPVIKHSRTDENPEADFVIVLGAAVRGDVPSLTMLERLNATLSYLDEYPDSKVIVSGGQGEGENISEAEAMGIWLEKKGVDPERIIREDQATNTVQNIAYSLNLIDEHGGDTEGRVAIVSSEYHLFRAKQIAQELGAEPVTVAAKTNYPILRTNYFIREGFGVVSNWVFGID